MYTENQLPLWQQFLLKHPFLIKAGDYVIFQLWHHLIIVAIVLIVLFLLMIYLVVIGIRQKNVTKIVLPIVIFLTILGLVYFILDSAIMD